MKYLQIIGSILFLVIIDMASKYIFYNMNYLKQTLIIEPAFNTGISWSLPVPYVLIITISIIGIIIILRGISTKQINTRVAVLLLAGIIGNLIDRSIYGGVRDFINIQLFNFPIFNLADVFLTIGIGIWFFQVILEKKN